MPAKNEMTDAELLELVKAPPGEAGAKPGGHVIGFDRQGHRISSVHPPQEEWGSSPRNTKPRANIPNAPGGTTPGPSVTRPSSLAGTPMNKSINPLDIVKGVATAADLAKATYTRREAKPGGGYRYFYAEHPKDAKTEPNPWGGGHIKETVHGRYSISEHPQRPGHMKVRFEPRVADRNGGGIKDEAGYTLKAPDSSGGYAPGGMEAANKLIDAHHEKSGKVHGELRALEEQHSKHEFSGAKPGGEYAKRHQEAHVEAGRNLDFAHKNVEANPEMAGRLKARVESFLTEARKSEAPLDLLKSGPPTGGVVRCGGVDYAVTPHQEPLVKSTPHGLRPPLQGANTQPTLGAPAEDPLKLLRAPNGTLVNPNGVDRRS